MRTLSYTCALLVVVGLLTSCSIQEQSTATNEPVVSLSMRAVKVSDEQWDLKVEFSYSGDREIKIKDTSLPWGFRDSLLLIPIVLDDDRTRLSESYYVDDPTETIIRIKPGQQLAGTIYLFNRFPEITTAAKEHDVLVFWSYELLPIEGPMLPRIGGAILIPKQ